MSGMRSALLRTLEARGYIHQWTDLATVDALAAGDVITAYVG
jgi:tyrosyl-tRNA synthetase